MSTDLTSRVAELAASIEANLAEDETTAREGQPDPADPRTGKWTAYGHQPGPADRRQDRRVQMVGTETPETGWTVCEVGQFDHAAPIAAHIARNDPARRLRDVKATRDLVAAILAERHDYNEGDSWYSCSQAVDPDPAPGEGGPGSGCSNDERAGKPCDCGRDARVARLLGIIASEWETAGG